MSRKPEKLKTRRVQRLPKYAGENAASVAGMGGMPNAARPPSLARPSKVGPQA